MLPSNYSRATHFICDACVKNDGENNARNCPQRLLFWGTSATLLLDVLEGFPHINRTTKAMLALNSMHCHRLCSKTTFVLIRYDSFYAVRRGKLVHVPRVQSHGRIFFWNTDREEGLREGSLVLVPVRDNRRRTFGLVGIDNVDSAPGADRSIFSSHEISFYQVITKLTWK